jgi:uncharacterized protein (DUF885 family)
VADVTDVTDVHRSVFFESRAAVSGDSPTAGGCAGFPHRGEKFDDLVGRPGEQMRRSDLLAGAALSCAAVTLREPANGAPPSGNPADAALMAFLDAEWADSLKRSPETASFQGDRTGDDRWDDVSLAAQAENNARDRAALARLGRLDRRALSEDARLNYDLYAQQLRDSIRGFDLGTYYFALNQRGGVQSDSTIVDVLPFTTVADYEALIARIRAWPRKVDQTIEVLSAAVTRRLLWPQVVMVRVTAQIDRLNVAPEDHPFFAPFKSMPAGIAAADASRLRAAASSGIAHSVLPAQQKLKTFMTATYLPAAPREIGLSRVPNGAALYAYFLETNTTTSLGADRIHALGLAEVARIRAEMQNTAPKTGYSGSISDVFAAMRGDRANYFETASDLLEAYRAGAKRIDPELVTFFDPLPRQPYGVFPIPDAIAPDTTAAYYQEGSLDGRRAGGMHVNLYQPGSRPIYEMPVLTLHESVPGHHLQFALANELGQLPSFRRTAYYVGYSEGWGLYAESLGYDIGVYDNPKAVLGAQSFEMWRAVRLVVDTGMHALGWSRERAIDYFFENAGRPKLDVTNEIDRYITDPGQACAYKIGQLKILELRERAKAKLGAKFDIRAFHATVLGAGSVPLNVLESRVDAWLAGSADDARHA